MQEQRNQRTNARSTSKFAKLHSKKAEPPSSYPLMQATNVGVTTEVTRVISDSAAQSFNTERIHRMAHTWSARARDRRHARTARMDPRTTAGGNKARQKLTAARGTARARGRQRYKRGREGGVRATKRRERRSRALARKKAPQPPAAGSHAQGTWAPTSAVAALRGGDHNAAPRRHEPASDHVTQKTQRAPDKKPARVKERWEGQRGHRAPDGNEVWPPALSPISIPTARPTTCVRVAAAHYSNRAHSRGATAKEVPASAAGVERFGAMQRCAKQSDPTRPIGVHHAPPLTPPARSALHTHRQLHSLLANRKQ